MFRVVKKIILWGLLAVAAWIAISIAMNWDMIQRVFLGGKHDHETVPPPLPAQIKRPAILIFSKTNAFRHEEAIPAANGLFARFARENGWGSFQTENGATFRPDILSRFDAVIFNNASGDIFTPEQQAAFKAFVEKGGGFLAIHASGDGSHKGWAWYTNDVIGTNFIGHPMSPQFQRARVNVEDHTHPATRSLPPVWTRTDEWYSFDKSPRKAGYHILATLDERSYNPEVMFGKHIRMGKDHPIAWWHCVGKGRVLYSGLGHSAEAYAEPHYQQMLLGALKWTLRLDGQGCDAASAGAKAK